MAAAPFFLASISAFVDAGVVSTSTSPPEPELPRSVFLWRVDSKPPSFFFGTIDVPYVLSWENAIFNVVEPAFNNADRLFVATTAAEDNEDNEDDEYSDCQFLPAGLKLDQVLPDAVYRRLKHFLEKVEMHNGLTAEGLKYIKKATEDWEFKRPSWVYTMLPKLASVTAISVPALDLHLADLAGDAGKPVAALQDPEKLCHLMAELPDGPMAVAINMTLAAIESGRLAAARRDMTELYKKGKIGSQTGHLTPELGEYIHDQLIERQNEHLAARAVELMHSHPGESLFFALDLRHLVGRGGVLQFLRGAGLDFGPVLSAAELGLGEGADVWRVSIPGLVDLEFVPALKPDGPRFVRVDGLGYKGKFAL